MVIKQSLRLAAWASSRLAVCRQESINFGAPQTEVATISAVVLPEVESPKKWNPIPITLSKLSNGPLNPQQIAKTRYGLSSAYIATWLFQSSRVPLEAYCAASPLP